MAARGFERVGDSMCAFGPQQLNELACNFFNPHRANGVISSCRNYERRRRRSRESRILCMRVYNFTTAFRRAARTKLRGDFVTAGE